MSNCCLVSRIFNIFEELLFKQISLWTCIDIQLSVSFLTSLLCMASWAISMICYGLWVMRWFVDSILEWGSLNLKDKATELITAICLWCLSREILETETHWFPAALWHPVALETWSGSSLKPHLSLSWQLHLSFMFFAAKIILLISILFMFSNKHP